MSSQVDIISKVFWFLLSGEIEAEENECFKCLTQIWRVYTRAYIPANFLRSHGATVSLPSVCSPLMYIIAEAPAPTLAPKSPLSWQLPSLPVSKLKVTIASLPGALSKRLSGCRSVLFPQDRSFPSTSRLSYTPSPSALPQRSGENAPGEKPAFLVFFRHWFLLSYSDLAKIHPCPALGIKVIKIKNIQGYFSAMGNM